MQKDRNIDILSKISKVGLASSLNVVIIQRIKLKLLQNTTNALWYVQNADIHKDLNMDTIKEAIQILSGRCLNRPIDQANPLAADLQNVPEERH